MIQTKEDLHYYVDEDKKANNFISFTSNFNLIKKYLILLRKLEYVTNVTPRRKIRLIILRYKHYRLGVKLGISIPPNTFGYGLHIPHFGCIIVNPTARFGNHCIIQSGVNISRNTRGGDSIYFGTGSKIMIGVSLGNEIVIGANSVVTKSFPENRKTIVGVPAYILNHEGTNEKKKI